MARTFVGMESPKTGASLVAASLAVALLVLRYAKEMR